MKNMIIAAALVLLTGPAVLAAACPRCGANHGTYTPPAKTVSARAASSSQTADRLMAEYHRKVQAARSQPAASQPSTSGRSMAGTGHAVSQTLARLATARQTQVINERASQVLKRAEEQRAQKGQKTDPKQETAQKQEVEKVSAVLNGLEASREAKRTATQAAKPETASAVEHLKQVSESSVEAAGSSTDDKKRGRSGRGIDSAFPTPVYAGDTPVRPAGASLMDLYHKKEKEMREDYMKRATKVIEQEKERQGQEKK